MLRATLSIVCVLLVQLVQAQAPANCTGTQAPRLLIAGDSWAQYMADDLVHNNAYKGYGHTDKYAVSETFEIVISLWGSGNPDPWDYAVSGSEAREWVNEAEYPYLQNVRNELLSKPSIDKVLLSIGGNDILAARCDGGWYKDMDLNEPGSEAALLDTIMAHTEYLVEEILAIRPNIQVILSSYDYPNFNVQGAWIGCFFLCNLCEMYACERRKQLSYSTVTTPLSACEDELPNDLITDMELNLMMQIIEERRKEYAINHPRVSYDNSIGLMHYYYGDGNSGPGSLPHPEAEPPYAPGGNVENPSLRENFRLVNIENWFDAPADPIHLTAEGYTYKAKTLMDNLIFPDYLRGNPDASFFSEGDNDGYIYVNDNSAVSIHNSGIRIGDNGVTWNFNDLEYYGILSFNTATLPSNAIVEGGSLYLIRSSANNNPFELNDRNPVLDIKSGHFGSSQALQLGDWNAPADALDIGCYIGKAESNKHAIRIDLQSDALQYINIGGRTQFRLYFDYADWWAEYINFYDGAQNSAFAPPSDDELLLSAGDNQIYSKITVLKVKHPDGSESEELIAQSDPVELKEGHTIERVLINRTTLPNGNTEEAFIVLMPLEHEGLATYMGSKAPFLDLWYTVALPVELTHFDAQPVQQQVQLRWQTSSEVNSRGFEVEYAPDGRNWSSIGFVPATGQPDYMEDYTYYHENPQPGHNYYRLRIVEEDGSYEFTDTRVVLFKDARTVFEFFPNPFHQSLQLKTRFEEPELVQVQITDLLGTLYTQYPLACDAGTMVYTLPETDQLPAGTYFIQIRHNSGTATVKAIKQP